MRVRSNRTTRNIDVTLASTVATVEEEPTADVARTLSVDLDDEVGDQALEELALGPNATFTVAVYGYGVDELDHYHEGGCYQVSWDGFDEAGKPLSSGVYLLRLQALGRVETRKMMLMK